MQSNSIFVPKFSCIFIFLTSSSDQPSNIIKSSVMFSQIILQYLQSHETIKQKIMQVSYTCPEEYYLKTSDRS